MVPTRPAAGSGLMAAGGIPALAIARPMAFSRTPIAS